jgi:hypothetical protein
MPDARAGRLIIGGRAPHFESGRRVEVLAGWCVVAPLLWGLLQTIMTASQLFQ